MTNPTPTENYWSWSTEQTLNILESNASGLTNPSAAQRRKIYGPNSVAEHNSHSALTILGNQFRNPLIGILIFAAAVSMMTKAWTDAIIVLSIISLSAFLGFIQEYRATRAMQLLLARIAYTITVRRESKLQEIPAQEVVPGDIILLNAGTMIPADGVLITSKDLFVNQAVLTGESMPAEKHVGVSQPSAPLGEQENVVFAGTSVRSGIGEMVAVRIGLTTQFGQISSRLDWRDLETDFEKGLKQFGYLLTRIMIFFVLLVSVGNVWLNKPLIDSLLFSIALAVGLSPELLPAVLTVTLAKGALKMATKGVIVRRLNCIESLGNINVLCCDKTGTLTEGKVTLHKAVNTLGQENSRVAELAYFNAKFQTGIKNALDEAILVSQTTSAPRIEKINKIDEIPYDFVRRRLTVVIAPEGGTGPSLMIVKGAVHETLSACRQQRAENGVIELTRDDLRSVTERLTIWGTEGYRVLAMATREVQKNAPFSTEDEVDLVLEGFLLFRDPPHADARASLLELKKLGVETKIITGDNRFVALAVAKAVGFEDLTTLTGEEMHNLSHEALLNQVAKTSLFAEVDPQQKETIVHLLKKQNFIVGYMGDGINDAPALLAADVGISVDSAVDVAKESADLVLTRHDLKTILEGIREGRITFANTLKYIFITTSANFGNMLSMALASLFLPFLPLLAKQILLNNLLSDIPALSIGTDHVDQDWRRTPHRWDLRAVGRFMIGFGLVSSLFDIITFLVLIYIFKASVAEFQTSWFAESLLTEILIIYVVRTFRPALSSRPSSALLLTSALVVLVTCGILASPLREYFGFAPLSGPLILGIVAISFSYIVVSELLKPWIMRVVH